MKKKGEKLLNSWQCTKEDYLYISFDLLCSSEVSAEWDREYSTQTSSEVLTNC